MAVAELRANQADAATRRTAITNELAMIATRERRLLDALADGDDGTAQAIRGRLREELSRRDGLTAELTRLDTTAPPVDVATIVRDATARAADLRGLLTRHVTQARQVVRLLLEGRLVCAPFDDATGRGYTFTAAGTYRRLGMPALESVNVGGGSKELRMVVAHSLVFQIQVLAAR